MAYYLITVNEWFTLVAGREFDLITKQQNRFTTENTEVTEKSFILLTAPQAQLAK